MAESEGAKLFADGDQPAQDKTQAFADDQQVGVVGDERAGGAEMDEGASRRRLVSKGMDVRHDVVPELLLVRGRDREVGVVEMRAHRFECRFGNRESQLPLGLGECEPETAPEPDAVRGAPQLLHRGGGVALTEGRLPAIAAHRKARSV
jgi:hypothetical protein